MLQHTILNELAVLSPFDLQLNASYTQEAAIFDIQQQPNKEAVVLTLIPSRLLYLS